MSRKTLSIVIILAVGAVLAIMILRMQPPALIETPPETVIPYPI